MEHMLWFVEIAEHPVLFADYNLDFLQRADAFGQKEKEVKKIHLVVSKLLLISYTFFHKL